MTEYFGGGGGFRNEIVWHYYNKYAAGTKVFGRNYDQVLFYSKSDRYVFNALREKRDAPTRQLVRENVGGVLKNKRDADGNLMYRIVRDRKIDAVWRMPSLVPASRERLGYATQKPLTLLRRILNASSNPGGVVLDPFCGCGTTIAAARELDRQWIGVDISAFAIDVIRKRMDDPTIPAYGIPYDVAGAAKLAAERPFAFETWAVTRLNGFVPNTKQVADGGVDGRGTVWEQPEAEVTRLALAQVKGGSFSLSTLRDFGRVIDRDRAALGCYLTLDRVDTHAARSETAGMGTINVGGMAYPRMQRWSMAEYFDQRPPLLPLMADPYTGKPMQPRLI